MVAAPWRRYGTALQRNRSGRRYRRSPRPGAGSASPTCCR